MPLARTADLMAPTSRRGTALLALNVITLEHAEAILTGAERARTPVILQVSQNAIRFHDGRLRPLAAALVELAHDCAVEVALQLDHIDDEALLQQTAEAGFSSVMFDAGALPYADNLANTRAAATWAHGAGLWLEAELGYVGGKPDAPASAHAAGVRTDPGEAAEYVAATGVDALAVAVGTRHAMTDRTATLDYELIARLREAVPVPLVLHGSSGLNDDDLRQAVRSGIAKINIGTVLNVAFTGAVRQALAEAPQVQDPRRYLARARDAMADVVEARLRTING